MTPNIPRAATWPPHIWDTTDPDEYAEAEAWVRSLFTTADDDIAPVVEWGPDSVEVSWPPPTPHDRHVTHCTHWTTGGEQCCQCGRIIADEVERAQRCDEKGGRR